MNSNAYTYFTAYHKQKYCRFKTVIQNQKK